MNSGRSAAGLSANINSEFKKMTENTPTPPVVSPVPEAPPPKRRHWLVAVAAVGIIAVLVLWLLPRTAVAPTTELPGGGVTVSAVSSTPDVAVGQQFTVEIVLDTGALAVTAADLIVQYDTQHLRAVSNRAGSFLPVELAGGSAEDGHAAITVGSGTSAATGSGTILTLTFEALAPGQATIAPAGGTKVAASGLSGNAVGQLVPVSVTVR
jgi:Cohesin domain